MTKRIKSFFSILKSAFHGFIEDNAFKLSASLSYYTVFSLGPLLIIIISLAGIFYRKEAVQGTVYAQLQGLIGKDAAAQIQEIIKNISYADQNLMGVIVGVVILAIGATGVFIEMQDSINYIWSVKAKPKKGWIKFLTNRLLSFSLIISMGFLLLVSLIVSALLDMLSGRLSIYFADVTLYVFYALNLIVILLVISCLFAVIFKILPDAYIRWKDAFIGAGFTAVLFLLGKIGIGYYIGRSNLGLTYGAAASIVIILTWIYYSSLILYFGAEFTKMYALKRGGGIKPDRTAVFIIKKESSEAPDGYMFPKE